MNHYTYATPLQQCRRIGKVVMRCSKHTNTTQLKATFITSMTVRNLECYISFANTTLIYDLHILTRSALNYFTEDTCY